MTPLSWIEIGKTLTKLDDGQREGFGSALVVAHNVLSGTHGEMRYEDHWTDAQREAINEFAQRARTNLSAVSDAHYAETLAAKERDTAGSG